MEEKLATYRANKAKQKQAENSIYYRLSAYFRSRFEGRTTKETDKTTAKTNSDGSDTIEQRLLHEEAETRQISSSCPEEHIDETMVEPTRRELISKWIIRACYAALWVCLWALFIELQFGAVFFTVSLILFTYFNTRTGPRDKREQSAYSVFNKNCERIQGTLTAEQMQKSMFGVPGVTS